MARPSLPESLRTGGQGRGEVSEGRPVTNLPSFAMSPLHPKPLLLSLPCPHRGEAGPPAEPSPPPTRQVRVTAGARGRSGRGPGVADTWGARKRRRRRGRVCGWVCPRVGETNQTTSESACFRAGYRAEEGRSSPRSREPLLGR